MSASPHHASTSLRVWDWGFVALLICAVLAVGWVGVIAHEEGLKTEQTKRQGEAWLKWLGEAAGKRASSDYAVSACAASPGKLWRDCLTWLQGPEGPMAQQRNAFTQEAIRLVAKCDPADRTLVGALSIEKLLPTPPGSAVPAIVSALTAEDLIEQKLQLRLAVCDKGAAPIKIGEVEF